ncbi:MAG TPA: hypothetical protein VGH30_04430, partial [Jatrophihabitantaceae bacterium]
MIGRRKSVAAPPAGEQASRRDDGGARIYASLLIVAVAILSAAAGWRAEVSGTRAAAEHHLATLAAIDLASDKESGWERATSDATWYHQVQQLLDERRALGTQLRTAPSADIAGATVDYKRALFVSEWALRDSWTSSDGGADASRYALADDASNQAAEELAGVPSFGTREGHLSAAEKDETRRTWLLRATVILVIALVMATYGHLARRRRTSRIWLACGTVV